MEERVLRWMLKQRSISTNQQWWVPCDDDGDRNLITQKNELPFFAVPNTTSPTATVTRSNGAPEMASLSIIASPTTLPEVSGTSRATISAATSGTAIDDTVFNVTDNALHVATAETLRDAPTRTAGGHNSNFLTVRQENNFGILPVGQVTILPLFTALSTSPAWRPGIRMQWNMPQQNLQRMEHQPQEGQQVQMLQHEHLPLDASEHTGRFPPPPLSFQFPRRNNLSQEQQRYLRQLHETIHQQAHDQHEATLPAGLQYALNAMLGGDIAARMRPLVFSSAPLWSRTATDGSATRIMAAGIYDPAIVARAGRPAGSSSQSDSLNNEDSTRNGIYRRNIVNDDDDGCSCFFPKPKNKSVVAAAVIRSDIEIRFEQHEEKIGHLASEFLLMVLLIVFRSLGFDNGEIQRLIDCRSKTHDSENLLVSSEAPDAGSVTKTVVPFPTTEAETSMLKGRLMQLYPVVSQQQQSGCSGIVAKGTIVPSAVQEYNVEDRVQDERERSEDDGDVSFVHSAWNALLRWFRLSYRNPNSVSMHREKGSNNDNDTRRGENSNRDAVDATKEKMNNDVSKMTDTVNTDPKNCTRDNASSPKNCISADATNTARISVDEMQSQCNTLDIQTADVQHKYLIDPLNQVLMARDEATLALVLLILLDFSPVGLSLDILQETVYFPRRLLAPDIEGAAVATMEGIANNRFEKGSGVITYFDTITTSNDHRRNATGNNIDGTIRYVDTANGLSNSGNSLNNTRSIVRSAGTGRNSDVIFSIDSPTRTIEGGNNSNTSDLRPRTVTERTIRENNNDNGAVSRDGAVRDRGNRFNWPFTNGSSSSRMHMSLRRQIGETLSSINQRGDVRQDELYGEDKAKNFAVDTNESEQLWGCLPPTPMIRTHFYCETFTDLQYTEAAVGKKWEWKRTNRCVRRKDATIPRASKNNNAHTTGTEAGPDKDVSNRRLTIRCRDRELLRRKLSEHFAIPIPHCFTDSLAFQEYFSSGSFAKDGDTSDDSCDDITNDFKKTKLWGRGVRVKRSSKTNGGRSSPRDCKRPRTGGGDEDYVRGCFPASSSSSIIPIGDNSDCPGRARTMATTGGDNGVDSTIFQIPAKYHAVSRDSATHCSRTGRTPFRNKRRAAPVYPLDDLHAGSLGQEKSPWKQRLPYELLGRCAEAAIAEACDDNGRCVDGKVNLHYKARNFSNKLQEKQSIDGATESKPHDEQQEPQEPSRVQRRRPLLIVVDRKQPLVWPLYLWSARTLREYLIRRGYSYYAVDEAIRRFVTPDVDGRKRGTLIPIPEIDLFVWQKLHGYSIGCAQQNNHVRQEHQQERRREQQRGEHQQQLYEDERQLMRQRQHRFLQIQTERAQLLQRQPERQNATQQR